MSLFLKIVYYVKKYCQKVASGENASYKVLFKCLCFQMK